MTVGMTPERLLLELTSLPTAAGREGAVVAYVQRWAAERGVEAVSDRYGNLMLQRPGAEGEAPIVFAAHMDHPAFVVSKVRDRRVVEAEFRGGVESRYFQDAPVRLHPTANEPIAGRVVELHEPAGARRDKLAVIELATEADVAEGDVIVWSLDAAQVQEGLVHAPACDDLAGAAAALAAFETLLGEGGAGVRVLLTRAEEVGFVGAIGACRSGILPRGARIVALENSRSFAESPIGGGPIVRVGDRTSTFDPDLTYRVGKVAEGIAATDGSFAWQRKLMPGGTCEASAYQALGYTATCVCLPLGNYHNMGESRIEREVIALSDYHGLVRLLIETGRVLDAPSATPGLKERLDRIFAEREGLLAPEARG